MKKFWFLLILFVLSAGLQAQDDPVAEKYLNSLSEVSLKSEPFRLHFTFTTVILQDESESSYEGTLVIDGKRYRLRTGDSEIIFNGNTLWNYLTDVQEVNITTPDPDDHSFMTDPSQLFTGFKDRFKYHYVDKQTVEGKTLLVIDLYPIDLEEEPYSRIRLQISEKDYTLFSAHYFGKGGTHYIIRINRIESNLTLPSDYFTFNPARHPDVEVIDLRDMN